ncbi:MAG: restriction endonuclease subunit S [Clostridia bacterium]|nr:restriction endonuclease subunit S [Clostridia bacterium]
MAKKKIPQIRHSRFDNEWETTKLGNIANRVTRKNSNMESTLPLTISAQYGLVDQSLFFNSQIASQNISNYYLLINGEFAYNKSTSQDYPVGAVKRLDRYDMGVLSTLYILFKPTEEISSDYLVTYFDADYWHKEIKLRAAEGARNHGLLNISPDDFFDIDLNLPKDIDEQQAIGTFLQKVDLFVSQRRDKLEKLQAIRLSMLEKMFPKGDDIVPKIRFKEFSGSWKIHKVSDFLTESRIIGNTGLTANKLTVKLWGKGVVEKSDAYGGSAHTQYYIRKAGQFMYGKLDFLHAAFGIVPDFLDGYESTLDSPAFDLSGIDGRFLMNTVIQENFYLKNGMIANGSRKAKRIHADTFLEMDILVPDIEEQKKIGDYFSQLDKQISFAQLEISKLQNLKKALLEKMFV